MAVFLSNGLFFSEILADNAGGTAFNTDGDNSANKADEFIEIQSNNKSTVNLAGMQIWSAKRGLLYDFGATTDTLEKGETATVVGQYTGAEPPGFYDAGLPDNNNNQGFLEDGEGSRFDTLYLVDTNTGEYIMLSYGQPPTAQPLPAGFPGTTLMGAENFNSGAPNGTSFTRDANGNFQEDTTPDPGTGGPVCFVAGTLIETADGPRPVEALRAGDWIVTRDRGLQPLVWLGTCDLSAKDLCANPKFAPIVIRAGALGCGLPVRDLCVSPQHRMLVRSRISVRMFGQSGVLVPAVKLLDLPGITRVTPEKGVQYVHLLFEQHEIVYAEGTPSESLLLGPIARASLGADALEELHAFFPHLLHEDRQITARVVPDPAQIRSLVARHARNVNRSLIEAR